MNIVAAKYQVPSVEQVQDIVEMVLLAAGEYDAAKHYILYRAERARLRAERPIPELVRSAFGASDEYFPSQLQKFQYFDKYARFNYLHMRRETWIETVDRAVAFLRELSHDRLPEEDYARLREGILNMDAMPFIQASCRVADGHRTRSSLIAEHHAAPVVLDRVQLIHHYMAIGIHGQAGCAIV